MELMNVHHNWASRPDDQRYLTLDSLYEAVRARRASSEIYDCALEQLEVRASGNDMELVSPKGSMGTLTHYAFGQLCARAGAPAAYLRSLPAALAQIPLDWSLEQNHEEKDGKVLSRVNGSKYVAALTSGTYGRIWDEEVVRGVMQRLDPKLWKVPSASYSERDPLRATTLYASDRDVFLFLVNENQIEADGEVLNRGIIVSNSEVGAATFQIQAFTYDYVCDNRIVWGAGNLQELRIKHTGGAPDRFLRLAGPALQRYVEADTRQAAETVKLAKREVVGNSQADVVAWLQKKGFTQTLSRQAYVKAEQDPRGYNPRTVWGLVQGLTDVAHETSHQDARVDLEKRAGALLESLAA